MPHTVQSAGDPWIIQDHNSILCFYSVSFLGISNTWSGVFITTEHCADISMTLSITASVWVLFLKSSNQVSVHNFQRETGTVFLQAHHFPFIYTAFHSSFYNRVSLIRPLTVQPCPTNHQKTATSVPVWDRVWQSSLHVITDHLYSVNSPNSEISITGL